MSGSESLLECLVEEGGSGSGSEAPSTATRRAYGHLLSVVSPRAARQFPFADGCAACLPASLRRTLEDWHTAAAADTGFSQNWVREAREGDPGQADGKTTLGSVMVGIGGGVEKQKMTVLAADKESLLIRFKSILPS